MPSTRPLIALHYGIVDTWPAEHWYGGGNDQEDDDVGDQADNIVARGERFNQR
jgi:hypothetical protein